MLLVAALLPSPAVAEIGPDALVEQVTTEVLALVRDGEVSSGDDRALMRLVDARVLPHFDFERMTMLAVGRDWRMTDAAQRSALVTAFRNLLVRTYSNALTQYRDESVSFPPSRFSPSDRTVKVRTEVQRPGAQAIRIEYVLARGDAGWKVFDVIVAGASLITSYRSAFSAIVNREGIDGLIRDLEQRNAMPSPAT